jgi:hypothetical protein
MLRTLATLTLVLTLVACAVQAQTTVPFKMGGQPQAAVPFKAASGSVTEVACSFVDRNLPKDTIVVAAGGYAGRKLDFQIDQSGHEATQFDIAVHSDKPVALLLGAYEPTIWSIGWSKGTRIVAVFVTGYHRQAVAGLPKGTPLIVSSQEEKQPCGHHYIGDEGNLSWINPKSRTVFGVEATRVYTRNLKGLVEIVETTREKTDYVTSPDTPPDFYRDKDAPMAGAAGLDEAVKKGLLRALTDEDIRMVQQHYIDNAPTGPSGLKGDIPPIAGARPDAPSPDLAPRLDKRRAYVVLKPMVFPAGLYGGNSATFVVPAGTPAPTGNPGHSTVHDLNKPSSTCQGPRCR